LDPLVGPHFKQFFSNVRKSHFITPSLAFFTTAFKLKTLAQEDKTIIINPHPTLSPPPPLQRLLQAQLQNV
jgi:hypothetical protein